jgi:hypothetical protein
MFRTLGTDLQGVLSEVHFDTAFPILITLQNILMYKIPENKTALLRVVVQGAMPKHMLKNSSDFVRSQCDHLT